MTNSTNAGTKCATPHCERRAAWMSITEGNMLGNAAPRRCMVCCDAIGEALAVHVAGVARTDSPGPLDFSFLNA